MVPVGDRMGQVLRALGDALAGNPIERDLHGVFEREVQQASGVRAVRLRELPARTVTLRHRAPARREVRGLCGPRRHGWRF